MLNLHPIHRHIPKDMKKIIILFTAILLPLAAGAQAQINTKKVKVGDFTEKVTKVVLNGNSFYDTVLKDEITIRWRISPYEFCTLEEFEELKGNDQYYFLIMTQGRFKKETAPGLMFLTLVKGGPEADKGLGNMLNVVSVPFASAEYPSGREFIFLPALLDIIQEHTLASMEKDINAYGGLGNSAVNIGRSAEMNIVFSEDDLSDSIDNSTIAQHFDKGIIITDEEDADRYMLENAENTLVSYVVVPSEPADGSYCYKMLIDALSYKLYYFRKHKISKSHGAGFLPEDLRRITAPRAKNKN